MNPAFILALVSDLYGRIVNLQQENQRLVAELEALKTTPAEART